MAEITTEIASIIAKTEAAVHAWLDRYSLLALRISMGTVIFGFGFLKYFPGVSPAEHMVLKVNHALTLGLMPNGVTMPLFATVECVTGLSLITGWGLLVIIYPMTIWAVGILTPLVLMPAELFGGRDHTPTLEGQYVLKDVILLSATLVIANATVNPGVQRARSPTDEPSRLVTAVRHRNVVR